MSDLPEISETCRCGSSIKLVGDLATDERLEAWRRSHPCVRRDAGDRGPRVGFTPEQPPALGYPPDMPPDVYDSTPPGLS